ncbi:MAG: flagellar export chaperone FliS [Lentisphaerae bacterium GWF2_45_14]|nr:MAG: flagellar export chaperone FliS [Lentisphaerae bacterium GWF2_45_14]
MAKRIIDSYQTIQRNTASPGQRVIMVYNAIVKNLNIASEAFGQADPQRFETINNSIQLADKLILELQLALDRERGGEVAKNLSDLYSFWREHLSGANAEKNPKKIDEVLKMAQELTNSWVEAEKQTRKS